MRRSVPSWAKGGTSGAAAGAATTGAGSSSSGVTTVAASTSETPSRWARAAQGAGRGIAEGAQGRQQHGEEDVDPLIGLALAHAEQAPLHHLEAVRLHIGQNKQQPILGGR